MIVRVDDMVILSAMSGMTCLGTLLGTSPETRPPVRQGKLEAGSAPLVLSDITKNGHYLFKTLVHSIKVHVY